MIGPLNKVGGHDVKNMRKSFTPKKKLVYFTGKRQVCNNHPGKCMFEERSSVLSSYPG